MGSGTFALALAVGAALLAMWTSMRFPRLGPATLDRLLVHAVVAFALLRLVPGTDSAAFAFVVVFGALLPALVYAFLVSLWVLRLAQDALGAGR